MTLQQIEASLTPGSTAYFSIACCWWTTNPQDLGELPDAGLPCCPYCGSLLMEASAADFIASAKKAPEHYGAEGLETFVLAHHDSGFHMLSWGDAQRRPVRFPRQKRDLSTEKSIRCVPCGAEFSEAETEGSQGCPSCGNAGVPMAIADDVTVTINWHELRILGIWADQWAGVCDENEPEHDSKSAVAGILRRLQAQHPDRPPLTLGGELDQLRETFPELEVSDPSGRLTFKPQKPS